MPRIRKGEERRMRKTRLTIEICHLHIYNQSNNGDPSFRIEYRRTKTMRYFRAGFRKTPQVQQVSFQRQSNSRSQI